MKKRRIGIVLLTGIGDVVHGLPVANGIKRAMPGTRVLWVAEPAPAEVLHHHPAVDEVVAFHKGAGLAGVMRLRDDLRGRSCQIALNLQRYLKSAFPLLFLGAPRRIGMAPSRTRDGIRFLHTEHTPEGPWRHTQDLFLDFLDVLEIPREPVKWRITLSREERGAQAAFFRSLPDAPVAGVVLATANRRKDWPVERSLALVEALEREFGYTVVLLGGPARRERDAARRVLENARASPVWGLADSVRRLIWTVEGLDLLVSPDTGPLHIAHALDVPVVGLFGHTNPMRVGPWRRFRDLVVDRYTAPGERPDPSGYEPREGGMELISVEDVTAMVRRARERYGAGREKARERP